MRGHLRSIGVACSRYFRDVAGFMEKMGTYEGLPPQGHQRDRRASA